MNITHSVIDVGLISWAEMNPDEQNASSEHYEIKGKCQIKDKLIY